MTSRTLTEWHAVDAPFTLITEWDPIPGRCSRCDGCAWLGESRWWHDEEPCRSTRPAEFLPDQPGR